MSFFLIISLMLLEAHAWSGHEFDHFYHLDEREQENDVFSVTARCDLVKDPGAPFTLSGGLTFRQEQLYGEISGPLEVTANINGFPRGQPRLRGIHVHESGNIINGCAGAGGHYNPLNADHGGPNSQVRHVGDLGNFLVRPNGTIRASNRDRLASLMGPFSIINRAVVVHAGFDDLGQGGNAGSLRTGNAGARLACCVIRRTNFVDLNNF